MDVSVLIRLVDQVSAPAKKVGEALGQIGDKAGDLANEFKSGFAQSIRQGFSVENVEQATRNAEAAFGRARARLMGAFGQALALGAPVVQSAKFDQSMRGLDKVLDVTTERLTALRRFALDTSALIPIAARDLVELMAEAAQGGVPEEELEAFAVYVANAAVAFDMAGAEIGERFAKLRNVYKLNQDGIEDLGDATNHLSNKMAAKAEQITDFANRAAGAAAIFKLTAVETSAVGTAMIAAGIVPETAARGFTALATRILSGGKDIDGAFKKLGMSRKQFLKDVETDAPAALQRLFETMATSKHGMQALIDLVGRDFADDFAKFLGNPELLAEAFALVADRAEYAGSAIDEAAKQGEGAVKKWDLFQNKLTRIAIVAGDQLLPTLLDLMDRVGGVVDRMAALAQANPEIASGAVQAVAALMSLSIASRVLGVVFAGLRLGVVQTAGFFLRFNEAGRNVATGWRILSGAGWILAGAFGLVKGAALTIVGALAGLTAPVWLAVGAIAAAGFAIWKYWDAISSFVSGFASVLGEAIGSAVSAAMALFDSLISKIGELLGIDAAAIESFKASLASIFDVSGLIEGAKAMLSSFWSAIGSFFSAERLSDDEKAGMEQAGRDLAQAMIDGLISALTTGWTAIETWVSDKVGWLTDALRPPDWLTAMLPGADDPQDSAVIGGSQLVQRASAAQPGDGGVFDGFLSGMANLSAEASAAGETLGASAGDRLSADAARAGAILGQAAAREISRAAVNVNVGGSGIARTVDRATSGALVDGAD